MQRFFERLKRHAAQAPGRVALKVEPGIGSDAQREALLGGLRQAAGLPDADWDQALAALTPVRPRMDRGNRSPACLPLLQEALRLREAALVIYRDRTLVEFQTEKIDGIHRHAEGPHVSWQIGGQREHHCHLALDAVARVLFSAEPVSCQGGGLNYTVWFLTDGPAGNPWRRDGYFSIVLNRPYLGNRPRAEVIQPVLDLHARHRHEPWVGADDAFLQVVRTGMPERRTGGR